MNYWNSDAPLILHLPSLLCVISISDVTVFLIRWHTPPPRSRWFQGKPNFLFLDKTLRHKNNLIISPVGSVGFKNGNLLVFIVYMCLKTWRRYQNWYHPCILRTWVVWTVLNFHTGSPVRVHGIKKHVSWGKGWFFEKEINLSNYRYETVWAIKMNLTGATAARTCLLWNLFVAETILIYFKE